MKRSRKTLRLQDHISVMNFLSTNMLTVFTVLTVKPVLIPGMRMKRSLYSKAVSYIWGKQLRSYLDVMRATFLGAGCVAKSAESYLKFAGNTILISLHKILHVDSGLRKENE